MSLLLQKLGRDYIKSCYQEVGQCVAEATWKIEGNCAELRKEPGSMEQFPKKGSDIRGGS